MGEQIPNKYAERTDGAEQIDTDIPVVEPTVNMDDIDKLLDTIDELLEEDAEAFVKAYQQRGGQ